MSDPFPRASSWLPQGDRFLYRTVSQEIRNRVISGAYQPGSRLPSARTLADEFGVSAITIRRAIRDLSLEGHLVGRQGLGVFVANRRRITRRLRTDRFAPIEEDMRQAGMEPGIHELSLTVAHPDGLPAGPGNTSIRAAYRLERVLLADNEPIAHDTLWLSKRLGDMLKSKLRGRFVMSLIQSSRVDIERIDYRFESATATDKQAALLNVITGFPLLVIWYTPIGKRGSPLLVGCTVSRSDRLIYELSACPDSHG